MRGIFLSRCAIVCNCHWEYLLGRRGGGNLTRHLAPKYVPPAATRLRPLLLCPLTQKAQLLPTVHQWKMPGAINRRRSSDQPCVLRMTKTVPLRYIKGHQETSLGATTMEGTTVESKTPVKGRSLAVNSWQRLLLTANRWQASAVYGNKRCAFYVKGHLRRSLRVVTVKDVVFGDMAAAKRPLLSVWCREMFYYSIMNCYFCFKRHVSKRYEW